MTAGVAGTGGLNAQASYSYPNLTTSVAQQDQNTSGDGLLKSQTLYDGLGRPVESDTFESQSRLIATQTTYDALGRAQSATNPARPGDPVNSTTYIYDSLGRVTQTQTPDGAVATSSYSGSKTTITDQAGNTKVYTYDALSRLINVLEDPKNSDNSKYTTDYQYDVLGDLILVSQGYCPTCQQRHFTYDSLGRLVSASNPESGQTNYTYNSTGTLQTRTDAKGNTTTYYYDALNRLTQKSYSGGLTPTVIYTYDAGNYPNSTGRLSTVSNTNASTVYTGYDVLGRVTSSAQVSQNQVYYSNYGYNLAGSLTSETYPLGRVVSTVYDGANRVNNVTGNYSGVQTAYVSGLTYAAHGLELGNDEQQRKLAGDHAGQ